jgi:hypothetical protein
MGRGEALVNYCRAKDVYWLYRNNSVGTMGMKGTQVCFAGMPALSISMLNGYYPKFIARRDLGIIPS